MDSKLDSILYIDDDVPNGVTDDEMSVDTDYENNRKCESDASSNRTQSSASLSSNNDNLSKSNETNDKQSIKKVVENGLGTPKSCHDNHDDSQGNSVAVPLDLHFIKRQTRVLRPSHLSRLRSRSNSDLDQHHAHEADFSAGQHQPTEVRQSCAAGRGGNR